MFQTVLIPALLGLVSSAGAQTILNPGGAGAASTFPGACSNITLKENWLIADCPKISSSNVTSSRGSTRSTLYLPRSVGSYSGQMRWEKNGHYEGKFLNECSLKDQSTLSCSFHHPNGTGIAWSSSINLSECVENRQGVLFSCLDDWYKIPSDQTYPVPDSFQYTAGLYDGECSDDSALRITTTAPPEGTGCVAWHRAGRRPQYREAGVFEGPNNGWEMIVYQADNCVGEVARIGPQYTDMCVVFPARVASFIVRPLWPSGSFSVPYVSTAKRRDVVRRSISLQTSEEPRYQILA